MPPATLAQLVAYYVNLLIIQYNQQPKARAEIGLLISTLLANAVFFSVLNGYDLASAVGVQLDILGKYAGVTRYFSAVNLVNFFGLTYYNDPNPAAEGKFGLSQYANFNGYDYNGTLTYKGMAPQKNALSDSDFRLLIQLAIFRNTSNHSRGSIDAGIFNIFGSLLRPESEGLMRMWYFVTGPLTPLLRAAIANKLLPVPMAVRMGIVGTTSGSVFGLTTYAGLPSPNGSGFADYAHYANLSGQILTYGVLQKGS